MNPLTNPIYSLAFGGTLYIVSFLTFAPNFGAVNMEDLRNLEDLTKELPLVYPIARRVLMVEMKLLELNFVQIKGK